MAFSRREGFKLLSHAFRTTCLLQGRFPEISCDAKMLNAFAPLINHDPFCTS